MQNEIADLIARFLPLSDEERETIASSIPIKSFKKGSILLREGQISRESYFNIEGIVRKYYIIEGEERTTAFYLEEEAINSLQSYNLKIPANHYLECVEDCRLAVLTFEMEQELFKKVNGFESLCRVSIEEELGAQQEKLARFMTSTPEERYLNLMKRQPALLQRVPQYYLASYLGVKPESLSRIRKRLSQKN